MDYFGPMVNKTARLSDSANGGQIVSTIEVKEKLELLQMQLFATPPRPNQDTHHSPHPDGSKHDAGGDVHTTMTVGTSDHTTQGQSNSNAIEGVPTISPPHSSSSSFAPREGSSPSPTTRIHHGRGGDGEQRGSHDDHHTTRYSTQVIPPNSPPSLFNSTGPASGGSTGECYPDERSQRSEGNMRSMMSSQATDGSITASSPQGSVADNNSALDIHHKYNHHLDPKVDASVRLEAVKHASLINSIHELYQQLFFDPLGLYSYKGFSEGIPVFAVCDHLGALRRTFFPPLRAPLYDSTKQTSGAASDDGDPAQPPPPPPPLVILPSLSSPPPPPYEISPTHTVTPPPPPSLRSSSCSLHHGGGYSEYSDTPSPSYYDDDFDREDDTRRYSLSDTASDHSVFDDRLGNGGGVRHGSGCGCPHGHTIGCGGGYGGDSSYDNSRDARSPHFLCISPHASFSISCGINNNPLHSPVSSPPPPPPPQSPPPSHPPTHLPSLSNSSSMLFLQPSSHMLALLAMTSSGISSRHITHDDHSDGSHQLASGVGPSSDHDIPTPSALTAVVNSNSTCGSTGVGGGGCGHDNISNPSPSHYNDSYPHSRSFQGHSWLSGLHHQRHHRDAYTRYHSLGDHMSSGGVASQSQPVHSSNTGGNEQNNLCTSASIPLSALCQSLACNTSPALTPSTSSTTSATLPT